MKDAYLNAFDANYPYDDYDTVVAGVWFNERKSVSDVSSGIFVAPFDHIQKTIKANPGVKEFSVVVGTGAMAPLHRGHVAMLEAAKKRIEAEGEIVAGGYIHPDNDAYVATKLQSESYNALRRASEASALLGDNSWIRVDTWASLWLTSAVNFTTILSHTKNYLASIFPDVSFKVYHVFGGDNFFFSAAFYGYGNAVCVRRGEDLRWLDHVSWFNRDRVLVVNKDVSSLSSTMIRDFEADSHMEYLEPEGLFVLKNDIADSLDEDTTFLSISLEAVVRSNISDTVMFETMVSNDSLHLDESVSVISAKDFVVGASNAGFDFTLPNDVTVKAPMLFPYSNLDSSGLPVENVISMSQRLWMLNYSFYSANGLTVGELPEESRDLWIFLGFTPDQMVAEVCLWHADKLASLL